MKDKGRSGTESEDYIKHLLFIMPCKLSRLIYSKYLVSDRHQSTLSNYFIFGSGTRSLAMRPDIISPGMKPLLSADFSETGSCIRVGLRFTLGHMLVSPEPHACSVAQKSLLENCNKTKSEEQRL